MISANPKEDEMVLAAGNGSGLNVARQDGNYHPTLWRTCRVLANMNRLASLASVLKEPGLSVEQIATAAGITETKAALSLRALQSRGLIAARRESRWVRYYPDPDPFVPSAEHVLAALRQCHVSGVTNGDVFRTVTAFTHPRRLIMLRCLQINGTMPAETLAAKCHISLPAIYRHLSKLKNRALIHVTAAPKEISLINEQPALTAVFLSLIESET